MEKRKGKKTDWMWAYFDQDTPFWAPVVGGGRTKMIITKGTLCKMKEIKRKGGKNVPSTTSTNKTKNEIGSLCLSC